MTRCVSILAAVLLAGVAALACGCGMGDRKQDAVLAESPGLEVLTTFQVGGEGRWDYLAVDPDARRLYVPRSTRVMVLDADKGTTLGEVANTPGVHGVALAPELNLGFASNGGDGTVSVFNLKTFATVKKIKAGTKPDAILYDPAGKKVYAFNHGSGEVTIINPAALNQAPVALAVGGVLEFGVADGAGNVYVNVEDTNEVVRIDSRQQKVLNRWSVWPGTSPTGLAIDPVGRRLFVGCGNEKMVILDADKGNVITAAHVGAGVDGVAFDPELGAAMSANGRDGTLTAVRKEKADTGRFGVAQTLKTAKSARTLALDPKTRRVYLPCAIPDASGNPQFTILVVGVP